MGLGLYTTVSSRVVPGPGAPGCTGVRLYTVGRRTYVLGARSVHHPVSSPSSVRSGRCLESRVTPPSATRILPSGLSPSVPGFHRLSRRTLGRLRQLWCERVADCDRRFGLSPTPEYSCVIVPPPGAPREAYPLEKKRGGRMGPHPIRPHSAVGQWLCALASSRSTSTSRCASSARNTAEPATKLSAPASAARSMVAREMPPSTWIET